MANGSSILKLLISLFVFISLEAISIVLIMNNGVIQQYKMMNIVRNVQSNLWKQKEDLDYYFHYKDENERLVFENNLLREKLSVYESMDYYNDTVLESVSPVYTYIPATVIKKSSDSRHNYIILNRGSDNGVKEGMGVVTSRGIVGVVSSVSEHYAYVISFLNTTQSVGVKVSGSNIYGPMSWSGNNPRMAILRDIPIHIELSIGDTISTGGISTIYPGDIPVGLISDYRGTNGLSFSVDVELFEDFNTLRHVNIVRNNDIEEIEKLEKEN